MIGKKIGLSAMLASAIHFAGGIGASLGFRNQRENNIKKSVKEHLQDLQDRLQKYCSYATPKGFRKNIGSTLPYKNSLKKDATNEVLSREKQFKGEILPDGRNRYFLKDGIYIDRLGQ